MIPKITSERLKEIISDPDSSESMLRKAEAYAVGVPSMWATDAVEFANMTLLEIAEEVNVDWALLLKAIAIEVDGKKELEKKYRDIA